MRCWPAIAVRTVQYGREDDLFAGIELAAPQPIPDGAAAGRAG